MSAHDRVIRRLLALSKEDKAYYRGCLDSLKALEGRQYKKGRWESQLIEDIHEMIKNYSAILYGKEKEKDS